MNEQYSATSRRPIAGMFRRTAHRSVELCIRFGIHPDAISYASLVASAVAGGCFLFARRWPVLLLIGPLLCYLRLWFNMLDGMVAIAAGKASRRGEILNDLPDRFSDVMVFAAIAESGLCRPSLGYWAAIAAVLAAYVGTMSQAVGASRQFAGIMSKPWRMVVIGLGSWITWMVVTGWISVWRYGTPFDLACVVILIGCGQTIAVRLKRTMAALEQ